MSKIPGLDWLPERRVLPNVWTEVRPLSFVCVQGSSSSTSTSGPGAGEKPEPVSPSGSPPLPQSQPRLPPQHHPKTGNDHVHRSLLPSSTGGIRWRKWNFEKEKWNQMRDLDFLCCVSLESSSGLLSVHAVAGWFGPVQRGVLGCAASAVLVWIPSAWCCRWQPAHRRWRRGRE